MIQRTKTVKFYLSNNYRLFKKKNHTEQKKTNQQNIHILNLN